jgi:hypothetical protein
MTLMWEGRMRGSRSFEEEPVCSFSVEDKIKGVRVSIRLLFPPYRPFASSTQAAKEERYSKEMKEKEKPVSKQG